MNNIMKKKASYTIFLYDMGLLFKTVGSVVKGDGAE